VLARAQAQRLDVTTLALGVECVERQRRLAGAARTADHHQTVARKRDVDVLEVVLACATHHHDRVGSR
jgi:hypothetical protein